MSHLGFGWAGFTSQDSRDWQSWQGKGEQQLSSRCRFPWQHRAPLLSPGYHPCFLPGLGTTVLRSPGQPRACLCWGGEMGKQIGCPAETGSVLVTTGWHLEGGAASVSTGDFQRAQWAPGCTCGRSRHWTAQRTPQGLLVTYFSLLSSLLYSSQGKYCASWTWKSTCRNFLKHMFL